MIRAETATDHENIRLVNIAAFAGSAEADLVDSLRDGGLVIVSLIAEQEGVVTGHILLSRVHVQDTCIRAAALAPVSVLPAYQRKGIGGSLILAGLDHCRQHAVDLVLVLGHPEYYPRFGFSAALAKRAKSPYSDHEEAWMALELTPGVLNDSPIEVVYPSVWSAFE